MTIPNTHVQKYSAVNNTPSFSTSLLSLLLFLTSYIIYRAIEIVYTENVQMNSDNTSRENKNNLTLICELLLNMCTYWNVSISKICRNLYFGWFGVSVKMLRYFWVEIFFHFHLSFSSRCVCSLQGLNKMYATVRTHVETLRSNTQTYFKCIVKRI